MDYVNYNTYYNIRYPKTKVNRIMDIIDCYMADNPEISDKSCIRQYIDTQLQNDDTILSLTEDELIEIDDIYYPINIFQRKYLLKDYNYPKDGDIISINNMKYLVYQCGIFSFCAMIMNNHNT